LTYEEGIAAAIVASSSTKDMQRTTLGTLSSLFVHTGHEAVRLTPAALRHQQPHREAAPHDSDNASVHSADHNRSVGNRSPSVYPVATPPPVPHHEHMSPASKQVKMQIANMLFDLSSQWTVADSPALKRLARRLMLGNAQDWSSLFLSPHLDSPHLTSPHLNANYLLGHSNAQA
jgi:hypothetical protein